MANTSANIAVTSAIIAASAAANASHNSRELLKKSCYENYVHATCESLCTGEVKNKTQDVSFWKSEYNHYGTNECTGDSVFLHNKESFNWHFDIAVVLSVVLIVAVLSFLSR